MDRALWCMEYIIEPLKFEICTYCRSKDSRQYAYRWESCFGGIALAVRLECSCGI